MKERKTNTQHECQRMRIAATIARPALTRAFSTQRATSERHCSVVSPVPTDLAVAEWQVREFVPPR